MKVSLLPCSIFSEIISGRVSLEQWISSAPELGLDGVDFSMMFLQQHTSTYIDRVKAIVKKYPATPLVMCTTYPDFTHPDAMQRKRELAYLKHDIALCSELGFKYLRVLAGQAHPETGRREGINWAIDGLRRAAEFAEKFGLQLIYENHAKPGAWDYVDFSFPLDIFREVFAGISDTGIRINYDLGNVTALGEDSVAVLKELVDKVETIHVTDMKVLGKQSYALIGDGVTPVKECFRVLKDFGWDGWLCIEETSGNGFEGMKDAVARTRRIWEEA